MADTSGRPVGGRLATTARSLPARWRSAWSGTSLRVRMVLAATILGVLGLVIADALGLTVLRNFLYARVDSQVVASLNRFVETGRPPALPAGGSARLPSPFYVGLYAADGTPVGGSTLTEAPPAVTGGDLSAHAGGPPFTVGSQGGGSNWRVATAQVTTTRGETLWVVVAGSLSEADSTLGRLRNIDLLVTAGVTILLGLAAGLLVNRSTRQLRAIESTARAIAVGDLSRRVPEADPRTEVGSVAIAINRMLADIESAFAVRQRSEEKMRRFVADASHELRTPLTSIRGYAELYRQGGSADPQAVGRMMRRIEDEAIRMGSLVDDLLLLARLDEQRPLEASAVDLLVVAADAYHDASAVAPRRPIVLSGLDGGRPTPAVITGEEPRVRQIAANLVKNALTHTPPEAAVAIRVGMSEDGRWGVLEVSDQGPGLTPEQASRVFERFYRADPSRSHDEGGSGLGLSIVSALVAAHHGRVEIDTTPGEGATFRVLLPAWGDRGSVGDGPLALPPVPLPGDNDGGGDPPADDPADRVRASRGAFPPPGPAEAAPRAARRGA